MIELRVQARRRTERSMWNRPLFRMILFPKHFYFTFNTFRNRVSREKRLAKSCQFWNGKSASAVNDHIPDNLLFSEQLPHLQFPIAMVLWNTPEYRSQARINELEGKLQGSRTIKRNVKNGIYSGHKCKFMPVLQILRRRRKLNDFRGQNANII